MSEPMTVEYTKRGWYAGEGGLGARGQTREEAVAKLRRAQEIVQRGAAKWQRESMEAMQRALGS